MKTDRKASNTASFMKSEIFRREKLLNETRYEGILYRFINVDSGTRQSPPLQRNGEGVLP